MRARLVTAWLFLVVVVATNALAAKEWTDWEPIYGNSEGASGIDVRFKRDGGLYVSYLIEFRNRYDRSANISFTYVDANGEQKKGWSYARGKAIGTASCNRCDKQPKIENLSVKLR